MLGYFSCLRSLLSFSHGNYSSNCSQASYISMFVTLTQSYSCLIFADKKYIRVESHSLSVCWYVRPSFCQPTRLSVWLSVCVSACLYVGTSVRAVICLSVTPSFCLSVSSSVYLSVCLSICLSVCHHACLSVCLSSCLSVRPYVCLFVRPCVC